jgi:hypothetical protein
MLNYPLDLAFTIPVYTRHDQTKYKLLELRNWETQR